jgi:hypothetical protein
VNFRSDDPTNSDVFRNHFELPLRGEIKPNSPTNPEIVIGDGLGLNRFSIGNRVVSPGDELKVSLEWQNRGTIPFNVWTYVHLIDPQGKMVAQFDGVPGLVDYPAAILRLGESGREIRTLKIPTDAAPGKYRVNLGGYTYPDLTKLRITANGQTIESEKSLGEVFVAPPNTRQAEIAPAFNCQVAFDNKIELNGYNLSSKKLKPGEQLALTSYWSALESMTTDYTIFVQILNSSGVLIAQSDGQPVNGGYPTSLWQKDEFVVDRKALQLPPNLPEGEYQLVIGLYEWPSLNRLPARSVSGEGNSASLTTISVDR